MREDDLWFCGLYDPKGYSSYHGTEIPVKGVLCNASIHDLVAEVELKLTFQNGTDHPVEAIFYFRHQEVALYYFDVHIRETIVIGNVHEKENANNIYDDAIASGYGSYMVEKSDTTDTFKMSLGNLPAGESCTVTIRYVTKLILQNDSYLFSIPVPSGSECRTDAKLGEVKGLSVNITAEMLSTITQIASTTHQIKTYRKNNQATVSCTDVIPENNNSGFQVQFQLEDLYVPSGSVLEASKRSAQQSGIKPVKDAEKFTSSHIFALNLCPKLEIGEDDFEKVDPSDLEILFLLDRSGSMSGSRIEQAKNALQIYLRSLPEGCKFNIFGFGVAYKSWKPQSLIYNQQSMKEASQYIQQLSANLGGTELMKPLSDMLSLPMNGVRNIVLMTDGEVNNAGEILSMVKSKSQDSRVFTLGIGEASKFLVEGIAKYGRGHAEFVEPGERVEAKVLKSLQYVLAPTLRHVQVDWGKLPIVRQAPAKVSALFLGEHAVIYGFVNKSFDVKTLEKNPVEVTVSGTIGKEQYKSKVRFGQLVNEANARLVEIPAVNNLIRELEKDSVNSAISTFLSVTYNLVSKNTSLVAVEERSEAVSDVPMQVHYVNRPVSQASPRRMTGGSYQQQLLIQQQDADLDSLMMNIARIKEIGVSIQSELHEQSAVLDLNDGHKKSTMLEGVSNFFGRIASAFKSSPSSSSGNNNNNNSNSHDHFAPPQTHQEEYASLSSAHYSPMASSSVVQEESKPSPAPTVRTLPKGSHIRLIDQIIFLQEFDGSWLLEPILLGLLGVSMETLESKFNSELMSQEFKTLLATILASKFIVTKFPELQGEWQVIVNKSSRFIKKECAKLKQDEQTLTSTVLALIQP